MGLTVNQTIIIHNFRVGGLSNSSILQIGSAGMIKPVSRIYNSGGFIGPAPDLPKLDGLPLVPLPPPSLPVPPTPPATIPPA